MDLGCEQSSWPPSFPLDHLSSVNQRGSIVITAVSPIIVTISVFLLFFTVTYYVPGPWLSLLNLSSPVIPRGRYYSAYFTVEKTKV